MRPVLALFLGLAIVAWPLGLSAQPGPHQPRVKEESGPDHYHYEYDDGICHYDYEFNWKDQHEHVDRQGDCDGVPLPRRPTMPRSAAPGPWVSPPPPPR
jgi:hypothetical protein